MMQGCKRWRSLLITERNAIDMCDTKCRELRANANEALARVQSGARLTMQADQLPATIMRSINTEPVRMLLRSSRSLPTATICLNISRMFPAIVTS